MHEDFERCWGAVQSRDPRFDGRFVIAVRTTRIYCRPSCPARTPRPVNVAFYPSAAAAQRAGYRACKRCRPDASPGSPEWSTRGDVVARAMRLLADGVVDREGVPALARRLGYSTRQLERLLRAELGAGPLALARAQRAQTARILAETTALPLADVAFAAGFASVRQFNDTVREVFAATPGQLRASRRHAPGGAGSLALRLPLRLPFESAALFGHLVATAVPGVEEVRGGAFRRTVRLAHGAGVVELTPREDHVSCRLRLDDLRDLAAAIARCRRLLDLDADPGAVDAALGQDGLLAASVAALPGRRLPRCVDEHEMALRVVLGQNVTTAASRALAARLVALRPTAVEDPEGGLTSLFPTAGDVATLPARSLPMPAARGRALVELARALVDGGVELGPGADWDRAREQLLRLPGVGVWSAEMVAMRALGDPDAFPSTDAGVLAGARELGLPGDARRLDGIATRWRPWRAYAVQHLWGARRAPVGPRQPEETRT